VFLPQAQTVGSSHLNLVLKLGMCGHSHHYCTTHYTFQPKTKMSLWINRGGHKQ